MKNFLFILVSIVLLISVLTIKNVPIEAKSKPRVIPPKLIFGIGSEAEGAVNLPIVKDARIKMLSSWYNGHNDLPWMTDWKNNLVPALYAKGFTLHLITFTDKPEGNLSTPYGPACGRAYPLSPQILDDMTQLAKTYTGKGKLYVSLFTEFQTYPCQDNAWVGSENYYKTLKDQYIKIKDIFHKNAPGSQVGISWGGWQSRWDDPGNGGGRSLFPYFTDIMKSSDFVAFQAMDSTSNSEDIKNMTAILGAYGKPVMLSHFKPDNGSQQVFDSDVHTVFTDSFIKDVTSHGLFALSFMDNNNISGSEDTYQFVKDAINRFGK